MLYPCLILILKNQNISVKTQIFRFSRFSDFSGRWEIGKHWSNLLEMLLQRKYVASLPCEPFPGLTLSLVEQLHYSLIPVSIWLFKSWSGHQVQGLLLTKHAPKYFSEEFELFHKYSREPWKNYKLRNDTIVPMLY